MTIKNKIHNLTNGSYHFTIVTAVDENNKETAFKMNGKVINLIEYKKLERLIRYGYTGKELEKKINEK